MDFKSKYSELLKTVEETLVDVIDKKEPVYIYEPFKYIMQAGGKRIRPVLCLITAGIFDAGGEEARRCAAAIEILHNFTLVHDDIMDGSPFRRNRETIHKKWDEARAILTGDLMTAFAYSLLPKANPNSGRVFEAFTDAFLEVNEGQGYDMDFNERKDLAFEDYLKMIKMKTSSLLTAPVLMGALLGSPEEKHLEALKKYAYYLGIAFQIQDDYLDMTADEAVLGKKTGLDIVEGKKTCLIIKAKDKDLEKEDRELMNEFYARNGLPEEYIPKMDALFSKYGVYEDILGLATDYFDTAIEALDDLPQNEYTDMLAGVCKSLDKRDK
jgi:geranylgeranyl diphosphate synthase type II